MKKFTKIAYIFLIIIIIVISATIYSSIAKETESESNIRNKTLSEIKYFESKTINLFNALNNIEFDNYKISVENENEKSKKYSLNMTGVLTSKESINWEYIKNEAEVLQNSISTMTLDLYEISLNNSDIINFGKEYDNLLIQIKNEDKSKTLLSLIKIYSYIPKFIRNCNENEQYEIVINTKLNILNAYSILDSEDWNLIGKYVQIANDKFSRLLTDINIKKENQYLINKCYISLNAIQSAIEKKDKEIFLIKYRNILEDLNNI